MIQHLAALLLLAAVPVPAPQPAAAGPMRVAAPPKKPPAADKPAPPKQPAMSCVLRTPEGPRGGRLEVEGRGFGQAPLVRIAGKVTRMLERTETKISVQIPADSDGGPVTVSSGKTEIPCGTLTIIGKD
jgi:hypothetical protein